MKKNLLRGILIAQIALALAVGIAFAAAQILTSTVSISISPSAPEPMTINFMDAWNCQTGDPVATVDLCAENASGGVDAAFSGIEDVTIANLRASRSVENPTSQDICITPGGLDGPGVVGSLLYSQIDAGATTTVQMRWDVTALGPGDVVVIPSAELSFDFCIP